MSTSSLANTPPEFLRRCLNQSGDRPHITLTWAQSLDSKIAGPGGKRVMISGDESMLMTHCMHDAIMIGINTLVNDDPRLQINLLPTDQDLKPPQPIILDPTLRFPISSRILGVWNDFTNIHPSDRGDFVVKQPWIICGEGVDEGRIAEVEDAGAVVIRVALDPEGRIAPETIPDILQKAGLRSIMIEGGSKILSSFLRSPPLDDGSSVVDSVIITVAPMLIGDGVGVVPKEDESALPELETVHTETLGKDAIMVCTVKPRSTSN